MMDKRKPIFQISREVSVVEAVSHRLERWRDYHEHRSNSTPGSTPGSAYGASDKVADAIFQARKPTPQNKTPDPVIDLRVSPEAIMQSYERAKKGYKHIFL